MLRHDAQSSIAAIRKGVDFQTLQYLMGHSDNSVIPENTLVHSRVWVRRFFVFGGSVEKRLETLHYTAKSGILKRPEGADCVGGIHQPLMLVEQKVGTVT
ncbi:MAG: hypothetical protein J6P40_05235 [Oscillospiraceae bacterium]|nr:hypothetical protein [Oscillospiraceae bacterium]